MSEKYKLKWEEFPSSVVTSFKDLRDENDFHDVTLVSEDLEHISAHKVVLAACSPYFKAVFKKYKERNPLICLNGIAQRDLQSVLDFMYLGEVQFEEEYLDKFLQIANTLKLKGVSERENQDDSNSSDVEDMPADDNDVLRELEGTVAPKQELDGHKIENHGVNRNVKVQSENANGKTIDDKINEFIVKSSAGEFSCAFCGKKAFVKRLIKDHVETHIQGLGISCEFCGKELSTRNSLRTHKYSYHRDMLMLNVR